jgi:hypothetical protein
MVCCEGHQYAIPEPAAPGSPCLSDDRGAVLRTTARITGECGVTSRSIGRKARPFQGGPLEHRELMPERENLRRELEPRAHRGSQRGQQGDEQRSHPAWNGISLWSATATASTGTEYSVGRGHNGADLPQQPSAQCSGFRGEPTALVVGEAQTPGSELFAQDTVFLRR